MRSALVPILLADPMPWAFKAPYAWDFLKDRARFAGGYKGALANTPGWTATPATHSAGGVLYASTASGALQSFASGTLRRTDKGVLIEGARTNLCLQSQTFDTSPWALTSCLAFGSGSTVDAATAPDGTTTADLITESTAAAYHYVGQIITLSAATVYTMSCYLKTAGRRYVYVHIYDGTSSRGCAVDLQTGTLGTPYNSATAVVETLANGWYRLAITMTTSGTNCSAVVGLSNSNTLGTYTGDGASGIYLWGAQLEAASFPSSYVPTVAASATRAADVLTVPVSVASPLTGFAEFAYANGVTSASAAASQYALVLGSSDNSNRLILYNPSSANGQIVQVSAATQAQLGVAGLVLSGVTQKVASAVATNDFRFASNGTLATPDTSGTALSDIVTARFGSTAGTSALFGYLRRIAIWNRALTDAELTAVTGG